jgi:hypothetical protein
MPSKEAKQDIIQVKVKVQDVPTDGGTLEEKAGTSSLVSRLILVSPWAKRDRHIILGHEFAVFECIYR